MIKNYPQVRLGDVADIVSGYAYKSSDFISMGIPVIKIKNVVPPYVTLDDVQYVSPELAYSKEKYVLKYNDILISLTGSNVTQFASAVGKVGRIRYNEPSVLNQRVGKIELKDRKLYDYNFLYYLISTYDFQYKLASEAKGSANQANINPDQIKDFLLPNPPLPIQRTIAATLSSLDDKIELNNRINANLEAQAQSIFKRWFVDFEPFRRGAFVDSELGKIPKGWQVKPLYDYSQYINGTSFKDEEYSSEKKGYPIIKIVELKNGITDSTQYCDCDKEEKYFISNGDILFSWSGNPETSIDTFIWHDGIGILNQHTFKVIPNIDIEYGFIYFLLRYKKTLFTRIASNKQTTGLGHVTIADLKRERFVYSEKAIKKYCDIINPIFDEIFNNLMENRTLVKIHDALLPELMSGEIEIFAGIQKC
ncbi:hypothetical protein FACS1894110_14470 [Spirochaetia bacterium]|nr:hypothetical protein FACS1894110_14470 [Spirochaetia bacterium]